MDGLVHFSPVTEQRMKIFGHLNRSQQVKEKKESNLSIIKRPEQRRVHVLEARHRHKVVTHREHMWDVCRTWTDPP